MARPWRRTSGRRVSTQGHIPSVSVQLAGSGRGRGWRWGKSVSQPHPTSGLLAVCSVPQSCPTLCNPMRCPPGSSVHEILPARILERFAISSSRGSSQPQGSNLHLLHWQADSSPLSHQGSSKMIVRTPLCNTFYKEHSCKHHFTVFIVPPLHGGMLLSSY